MLKALLSEQDLEKLEKGLYSLSPGVTLEALIQKNLQDQLIYFKTKIADHTAATYGTAKYDLHQLLVAVIDAILTQPAPSLGKPQLLNFYVQMVLAYLVLCFYTETTEDPGVTKLARVDHVRNFLRRLSLSAPKTTTTSHTYQEDLKYLLYECSCSLLGYERVEELLETYSKIHEIPKTALQRYAAIPSPRIHFDKMIVEYIDPMMRVRYKDAVIFRHEWPLGLDLQKLAPEEDHDTVIWTLLGCHGMDATDFSQLKSYWDADRNAQQKVAARMKKFECKKILQLGDLAYFNGVGSPIGPFYARNRIKYGFQNDMRVADSWIVAGNHDYGFWGHYNAAEVLDPIVNNQSSLQRISNQILHTYTVHDHWNMPYRYYFLMDKHYVLFVLDTNTLIFDAIQQEWFVKGVQFIKLHFPHLWIIVAAHHPLVYLGKRSDVKCEWKKYLDAARERMMGEAKGIREDMSYSISPGMFVRHNFISVAEHSKEMPTEYHNIGRFVLELIIVNDLQIDIYMAAHEHLMATLEIDLLLSSRREHKIFQLTAGGGGGPLDGLKFDPNKYTYPPESMLRKITSPFYAKLFGFFQLRITRTEISYKPEIILSPGSVERLVHESIPQIYGINEAEGMPSVHKQFNLLLSRASFGPAHGVSSPHSKLSFLL
ncbi:MAG: hypothetical protein EXR81_03350 [Gammaproteobacteria bacterium]|nr:hypothetical protein [Gammaproteobacteria bacterium]